MENNKLKPYKLSPVAKFSPWGMKARDSLIGQLTDNTTSEEELAELWLGAHPSMPSQLIVKNDDEEEIKEGSLLEVISGAPEEILGKKLTQEFGELPFLFKVLSIAEPLSIQAHPNKELAEILHRDNPERYPDSNHKPEVAVALTPVSYLQGFRPFEQIKENVLMIPELRALVGGELIDRVKQSNGHDSELVRDLFAAVMRPELKTLGRQSVALRQRLEDEGCMSEEDDWVLRLLKRYTYGDVGIYCFYLFNYETLAPGEALFSNANEPHAYLSGEIIEVMANSDNVVRAGLTSKYRDVETLVDMLSYRQGETSRIFPESESGDGYQRMMYKTPAAEFELEEFTGSFSFPDLSVDDSPIMYFSIDGEAVVSVGEEEVNLQAGEGCFIPAALSSYSLSGREVRLFKVTVPFMANPN